MTALASKKFLTREKIQLHLESVWGYNLNGEKNSSILYNLKQPIEVKGDVYEVSMSLSQFTCPIAFYVVNENNNSLNIEVDYGSSYIYATIPEGNYNINQLIDIIKQQLGNDWVISINLQNYKLTFTNNIYDFKIMSTSTCWRILGFIEGQEYNSSFKSLSLPNVVNLLGTTQVKIWCPTISMRNIDGKTGLPSSILSSITVNDINGGMILYNNLTGFNSKIKEKVFTQFQIDIKDEFDKYINLHGCDYAMVLELEYYYEKEVKDDSFISLTGKDM
jgi:hypothetical protein